MAQARIAARVPSACAGCYGQNPDLVYVDFGSAIEGAPIDPDNPRSLRVEWVVICEECVRRAFALLPKVADSREKLGRENAELQRRLDQAEQYASRLEDALSHRPTPEPRAPRPTKQTTKRSQGGRKPRYAPKATA